MKTSKGGINLKIKLDVSEEHYEEVKGILAKCGIEIDNDADFVLSENNKYPDRLHVKDTLSHERLILPVGDIVLIETFRHVVEVNTQSKTYQALDRLYKVLNLLDPEKFLRISNSVVIAKDKVKSITPTFSMKYILTMTNGKKVDVTRSYYYIFKESFGI